MVALLTLVVALGFAFQKWAGTRPAPTGTDTNTNITIGHYESNTNHH